MMTKPEDSSREEQCLPGVFRIPERLLSAYMDSAGTAILYANSLTRTFTDFVSPFLIAANSFWDEEKRRIPETPQEDNISDYNKLLRFNMQIASTGLRSSAIQMHEYHRREFKRFALALFNTLVGDEGRETVDEYMAEKAKILYMLAVDYPDAIRDVGEEYGFHFDNGRYIKVSDTDRMDLYQVLPTEPGVEVRPELKPIMVVHPYVLGASILAFLPGERKSYVHAFANQGIPTYVRIIKDIASNPSVQGMTGEDDARDTAVFCKLIKERHGRQVTLNGFCQGGFVSLADVLTGELDGLVDTLITCVAPMDGTRSKGLVEYLEHITPRFRDLAYATKTMPGGGRVIDGTVMSWVYKLKSIEREAPLFTYYRDLNLFQTMVHKGLPGISKTAAAINHWLMYDRNDLPVSMTRMSFDSYTVPVSSRGELPFKLFGRTLNFDYIREKDIKFQICYAAKDDLVDKPSAKAPMDFVDVECAEFPKGHAAIATSWSHPETDYALHKRFPNGQRGPVRLQLDLSDAVEGGLNSAA